MTESGNKEDFSEDPQAANSASRLTELGAASRPLTTEKYRPSAPGKRARRLGILRQALALPTTLVAIARMIREDFAHAALDENLWAFWGFHQEVSGHEPSDPHYRARRWEKVRLNAIGPQLVKGGLPVWELAFMMNVAMENEDPIMEYTVQNGEGFRFLLPTLGRFMGKNQEQARYAAEHNVPWCESSWCAEERRHSNAFARMIERLVNVSPSRDNPNQPMVVTPDEASAVRLLMNRQVVEWSASSSYIVMAAHARGELRLLLRNILRDEVKHLSILSCADSYLFGTRPLGRLIDWVKMGIEFYRGQRKNRSGGEILGGNPVLSLEGIVAHLLTAFYLTRWLRTVPLLTLETVFETPSQLADLAAFTPPPEQQARIDRILSAGEQKRVMLARWIQKPSRIGVGSSGPPRPGKTKNRRQEVPRSKSLARRQFESDHRRLIERIVANELDGFVGAEAPTSKRDRALRRRIDELTLEGHGLEAHGKRMLRRCLRDHLRHYQIRNNRHVLGRDTTPVRTLQTDRRRVAPEGQPVLTCSDSALP